MHAEFWLWRTRATVAIALVKPGDPATPAPMSDGDGGGGLHEFAAEICVFAASFVGLAIVCDDHLVVALETLCLRWNVRVQHAALPPAPWTCC